MKKNNQPSLKAHQAEIKAPVLLMTDDETLEFETGVVNVIEQAIDAEISKADLIELAGVNLVKMGIDRNPEFWELCRNNLKASVIKSRQITEKTFEGIWTAICQFMLENGDVKKPKAQSKDAVRMDAKREELAKMSIAELEAKGLFAEAGRRKEKAQKEANKVNAEKIKDLVSENLKWAKENLISNLKVMALLKSENGMAQVIALANKQS
jgi:hypothetical protein